ncbi:MAG TPA: adenylate/guanylate cyclase domain-containing protein [Euzebyales bacterium]
MADEAAGARSTPRVRRRVVTLSMGTWLAIALLAVAIVSLIAASAVTLTRASSVADTLLHARSRALLSLQSGEVERYLQGTRTSVSALAASERVARTADDFATAYQQLGDLQPADVEGADDELATWYRTELVPGIGVATGQAPDLRRLLPETTAARYLQHRHVIVDADPSADGDVGEPAAGDTWSTVHAEADPRLTDLVEASGLEDLYLIDADTGLVVYSVEKLPDFATSLDVGPYSGSLLAQAFRRVRDDPEAGVVSSDIAPYLPASGQPQGFVAAPVHDGDRLTSVIAARISLDEIDRIMTVGGDWEDVGFGATGETFLVGADGRMRSISRAFVEDRAAYLQTVADAETATVEERAAMTATGTTAIQQRVFTDAEMADVATGDTVDGTAAGYLGEEVWTALEPVDVPGPEWSVALQVIDAELTAPTRRYRRQTIVALAVLVLIVSFLAVGWARNVFRPIRTVAERLGDVTAGRSGPAATVPARTPREFAVLASSVERMIRALERRRAEVETAIRERRDMVRTLLPPTVAERLDAGDSRVVDEIARASIAVVTVNGLAGLVQRRDEVRRRALLDRIVGELDDLARRNGLDRVKMLGDAYFAGCGLDRPYLDHAPRAVAFARAAQQAATVAAREVPDLSVSIGVDTGPVTVGLAGSAMLVYDLWGDTATNAHALSQAARAGEILISDRSRAVLPSAVDVSARHLPDGTAWRVDEPAPVEESAT